MYALIKNNTVQNVIECDQAFADSIKHEWDDVIPSNGMGKGWEKLNGMWTAPVQPAQPGPAPIRTLTHLQYMNRFTDEELEAIYTAAKTVVKVEVWLAKFNAAGPVDLDDQETIKGLQAMEAAGLLATGRAAEILK